MMNNVKETTLNNFKPDIEISITNDKVSSFLKKILMEYELGIKKYIYFDEKISEILLANVYYIGSQKKKELIRCINKNCNLDINPNILKLQLNHEGIKYIFCESYKVYGRFVCIKEFNGIYK